MSGQKLLVVATDTKLLMITLDLADPDEALATAKRVAEHTGRTVTVRDAKGEVLETIRAPGKN